MSSDRERVNGWLSRLDPASEEYPPIVVTRAIARLANADRAAALRDVETLLRRIRHVHTKLAEPEYDMTGDDGVITPRTAPDLAALIVDRVLGAEQDGTS